MAGIGFELKKLYQKQSVSHMFVGAFYSTVVVVGPTLIIILLMLALNIGLQVFGIEYYQREIISSTMLYVFIFSMIVSSPFNAVFSRYIADKIYCRQYADILPSYYVCLAVSIGAAALLGLPFALRMYVLRGLSITYILLAYSAFILLVIILTSMVYLQATKDYKIITLCFVAGVVAGVGAGWFVHMLLDIPVPYMILIGVACGFLIIAGLLSAYIRCFFTSNGVRNDRCIQCLWKYRSLFFCNLFYSLGVYVHNFLFWTQSGRLVVANSFVSHSTYDMATFLAVFTNLSFTVLFTVMVETEFHDEYQRLNVAIDNANMMDIEQIKESMFKTLWTRQGQIMGTQVVITIIIYILSKVLLPLLGVSSNVMSIYAVLCVAFYVVMVMYGDIVVLFYMNDANGALATSMLFFIVAFVGTIYSCGLRMELYGLGLLLGAIVGWTVSYFRIRYLYKHFKYHIFCKVDLIRVHRVKKPCDIVYKRRIKEKYR